MINRDYRGLGYTAGVVLAAFVGGPRTLSAGAWIVWLELARTVLG